MGEQGEIARALKQAVLDLRFLGFGRLDRAGENVARLILAIGAGKGGERGGEAFAIGDRSRRAVLERSAGGTQHIAA
ncbi:hypothetical protein WR25_10710 [Diploscapter pachys]|uniref:Uncharacterized protein n=1 Tax=Diploscapter pachys TaxID=2018661 RepID=A0A2A2JYA0_9BILA|nr:hypothetical protein WR25_10710 [Diploscapter pachys]